MKKLVVPALICLQPLPAQEPRLTDPQAETLAREALLSSSAALQASTLKRLQKHHFKSSLAKEREVVLYAQGTLEDRLGQLAKAAATFHRLEQTWPRSGYLPEAQAVMAQAALEHNRPKEAETRLRKALAADLPAESVRRSQELLLWCLADQGRAAEGLAIVDSLKPLGTARPSELGLVGILESLCLARRRAEAQSTLADYHKFYPRGPHLLRVNLAWAKLLGVLGEAAESAQAFQKLIQQGPKTREADEARLALATLLTDGRLSPKDAQGLPNPANLLAELDPAAQKDSAVRQALLVKLRLALRDRHWPAGLQLAGQLRAQHPPEGETVQVTQARTEIMRGWAQEVLDKGQPGPILPFLDGEGVRSLTPGQRQALAKRLAELGLPEASMALAKAAPAKEQPILRRATLEASGSSHAASALGLSAKGGGSPQEALLVAKASAAQGAWPAARTALAKAKPGPERIQVLLALLNRPVDPKEKPGTRLREAEGWLARAREKAGEREPLALFAADLRARGGDWRGALALYPKTPLAANLGWVAFMRATCHFRLGQSEAAREALKLAGQDPAYRAERDALAARVVVRPK